MPVITSLVAAISVVTVNAGLSLGLGAAAWAIGDTLSYIAIGVGLSYGQAALARTLSDKSGGSGNGASPINAPEARGNVKQSTPAQRILIGETRAGGAVFFYEVKPPYLYLGIVYCALPISDFRSLYVNEHNLTFNGLADNEIVSPLGQEDLPNYPGRLQVCVQRGSLDQGVNAIIAADFPELGSLFQLPGLPCAVFKCDYGDDYDEYVSLWGNVQIPDFQWVVRGVQMPDPRKPSHRLSFDPSDAIDLHNAIKTWSYSDNAALSQNYWAAMPFGLGAGPERIEWVKESLDFDDESVPLKDGGAQRRYVVSAVLSLTDKPNTVMDSIFTANRGFASQRRGKIAIYSSQPIKPVMTITDAMLQGAMEFRRLKPKKELVNIASCTFVAPDREYQDAEGPTYRRDDFIEADGEEFSQNVRLSCTPTHQRAQRLLKGFVIEARLNKFLNINTSMKAYGLREGMVVQRYSETGRYTKQNGLYSVEQWALADNRTSMSLSLAEYDPVNPNKWNAQTDEQPFVTAEAA
jgi:hypothetical protein